MKKFSFPHSRGFRIRAILFCLYALTAFAETRPAAANATPSVPRDRSKGSENVRSVVRELQLLFAKDAPDPAVLTSLKAVKMKPIYCKITKLPKNQSIMVISPRFTKVKEAFRALDGIISSQTFLECVEEQNMLILRGPSDEIEACRETVLALDRPTPQILVEAKIVEVFFNDGAQRNMSFSFQNEHGKVGISADAPGQTTQPTNGLGTNWSFSDGNGGSFGISFQWLKTAQDAKILSAPTLLITRNENSIITTGSDIPIQEANTTTSTTTITTKFKRVGVSLEVEPVIINSDNVTLKVLPSVKNVSSYQTVSSGNGQYSVPVISVRSIETYLRMRDKQVAMMGGLYSSTESLLQERVPFFSDLPIVGEVFTGKTVTKEVTHLIFFLKVYVINHEDNVTDIFYDPNASAALLEKIGTLIQSSDSNPIRETTFENLEREFWQSIPFVEKKKRSEFRKSIKDEGEQ